MCTSRQILYLLSAKWNCRIEFWTLSLQKPVELIYCLGTKLKYRIKFCTHFRHKPSDFLSFGHYDEVQNEYLHSYLANTVRVFHIPPIKWSAEKNSVHFPGRSRSFIFWAPSWNAEWSFTLSFDTSLQISVSSEQ